VTTWHAAVSKYAPNLKESRFLSAEMLWVAFLSFQIVKLYRKRLVLIWKSIWSSFTSQSLSTGDGSARKGKRFRYCNLIPVNSHLNPISNWKYFVSDRGKRPLSVPPSTNQEDILMMNGCAGRSFNNFSKDEESRRFMNVSKRGFQASGFCIFKLSGVLFTQAF